MLMYISSLYTVRVFRVQCRAGYSGNDVIVNCSTQGESEAISYVYYRVNGGGFRVGEILHTITLTSRPLVGNISNHSLK